MKLLNEEMITLKELANKIEELKTQYKNILEVAMSRDLKSRQEQAIKMYKEYNYESNKTKQS